VGRFLTEKLISLGHSIVGLDLEKTGIGSGDSFTRINGDIRDKAAMREAVRGVDMIIHLAAKHHDFGISEQEYFDVNEGGMRNILECATEAGVKKFIFFSSVAIYGAQKTPPAEETAPVNASPYGRSKYAAERLLKDWAGENPERQSVAIRPAVVFGPYNYANMYSLIKQIHERKFIFVGSGDNIKSVAYVENLVEAVVFLMERLRPGIDYFNYVDEPQMRIKETVNTIVTLENVKLPKVRLPVALAVLLTYPFDILEKITGKRFPITSKRITKFSTETNFNASKIRAKGFKQPITLQEGFRRTIEWYLKDGKRDDK
jgi:nucleoside-diphosphate-sugar epimerase